MRLRVPLRGSGQARFAWVPLIALILAFSGAGCQAPLKHYALHGRVISKSAETQQVTVDHDEIPGFMPAMAMPYQVKDLQGLNDVQPGDTINADVVERSQADYWLEHIEITDKSGRGKEAVTAPHELTIGEKVPDVSLTNQDGAKLTLSKFKGKSVLITFVYTRCPLPTFCPLISSEFAAIHKDLGSSPQAKAKTHLMSITLDPVYDTPPVLRKYGLAYLQDDASGFQDWDFVRTSPEDLRTLATAFGLEYYRQENQISHSMSTVLLSPDGTVAATWPGNAWKTDDVLAAIRKTAGLEQP